VPFLGFFLSAGLALLAYLLLRRMDMYREARDEALREIAERRRTQEALDASRSLYGSVFESATDGLIIIDSNDTIVEANPAACRMHGFGPGELTGRPVRELMAEGHEQLYDRLRAGIEKDGDVRLDSVDVRRDGSTFDVEVACTGFTFESEPRVLAILTDVSERKQAREKLATLSRKVLMAQEQERLRLSRDLHDELGQLLTAQRLELDWLERHAAAEGDPDRFKNAMKLVEESATELRRVCKGLRPPLLDDLGLEPAVRLFVEEFVERTGIQVDLDVNLPDEGVSVPKELALCTYRILQESLTNVSRHSGAEHVDVSLVEAPPGLRLSVYDDGRGFPADEGGRSGGSGITGMHERAHLVGGEVEVRSTPGEGTRIAFSATLGEVEQ
jgi:PAS domain S-box-containing protein